MNQLATLGGGCYWCLEALYQRISGIASVVSGYSGGDFDSPTAEDVYAGITGHAEVVQLNYDPDIISYREILEIFFTMHDPTTLNRQGNDIGEIYRSVIFYHSDEQKKVSSGMMENFAGKLWDDPVVTQLKPYTKFWPAGLDSQDFYNRNPYTGYCMAVINPKVQKLRQKFAAKLKPETAN